MRNITFYLTSRAAHRVHLFTFLPSTFYRRWRVLFTLHYFHSVLVRRRFYLFIPERGAKNRNAELIYRYGAPFVNKYPISTLTVPTGPSSFITSKQRYILIIVYPLYLLYYYSKMLLQTSYLFFDEALKAMKKAEDADNDDDTVAADNRQEMVIHRVQLQILASSNQEIDERLEDLKEILETELQADSITFVPWDTVPDKLTGIKGVKKVPSKDKLKYFKGYKVFSGEVKARTIYLRFALKIVLEEFDREYFNLVCQENINEFSNDSATGWTTKLRVTSCTSDAIQPCILCLLVNVPEDFSESTILAEMLQEITDDYSIGLKFNTFSGAPKALAKRVSADDWTLKKVLQVEGERKTAIKAVKAIDKYFKQKTLLGSRITVVNTAKTGWASSAKGKKAYIDGMQTQIILNDRLLCMELEETNVFKAIKINGASQYLLEFLMSMKSKVPVTVHGETRYGPIFHSCCPKSYEDTVFYYPEYNKEQAESIIAGFPLFLSTVLKVKAYKVCRTAFLEATKGGTFDKNTYQYTPPGGDNILEFILPKTLKTAEQFLSSAEHNALARDEDDLTQQTNLRDTADDVSTLSGGTGNTDNTITLREKLRAMTETNAALAQQNQALLQAQQTSEDMEEEEEALEEPVANEGEVASGEEEVYHEGQEGDEGPINLSSDSESESDSDYEEAQQEEVQEEETPKSPPRVKKSRTYSQRQTPNRITPATKRNHPRRCKEAVREQNE
jgi:tetratricopeptide (TPR) repeat protein